MLFKTGIPKSKLNCILLIDDDKLTNFMNKIIVDGVCCPEHVIRKESANSALEYILDSSISDDTLSFPDLIFLDMDMPYMDGWQFLESFGKLKSKFAFSPLIVMLSSFVDRDSILKASGFSDLSGIFKKPMSVEVYNSIVNEYFTPGELM